METGFFVNNGMGGGQGDSHYMDSAIPGKQYRYNIITFVIETKEKFHCKLIYLT